MIFNHTWRQVLDGSKTQTRRLVKPGEVYEPLSKQVFNRSTRRNKCYIGQSLAVQPGRGQYAIWYRKLNGDKVQIWNDHHQGFPSRLATHAESDDGLCRWQQLRIRITAIRQEPLQDISEGDACSEGYKGRDIYSYNTSDPGESGIDYTLTPRDDFMLAWDTIHTKPGTRWADNPDVWVLEWEPINA